AVRQELDRAQRHLDLAMYRTEQDVEASAQLLRMIEPRAGMPPTGAWAINARNLLHVAQLLRTHRPRRVLELGSGSSTVWLGYLLELVDGELTSLDHLEEFAGRTRQML
ncbi:hypothetical protein PU560_00470, partial [Georgenia sp. 10Sc9-8]|nr:hypothetical protein [Georgenia halotolerans]